MQGNIEAMIDGVFIPSKERLENLKLDIERLSRLVYDVEKIVSNDNKNQVIKYKYDVVNEVNNILKTFEKEIISKKIVVNFTNKNKCLIFANKDKMNQVIINLISNAIKYTDENGKIGIDIIKNKDCTQISINDNGIGIKEKDIPYIFEYLYRADKSRSRNTGGSGIGLYVVKNIVEAHRGIITVESKVNKGSKFTIKIPNK